ERVVVDVHDAEATVVAPGPLEVVQERPHHVAAHVRPGGSRVGDGGQVVGDVGDAPLVVHATVDDDVLEGRTVLGDHERLVRVAAVELEEQVGQPLRLDVPPH